ncbi:MAG: hypothetical protein MJ071_02125 [Oscillospiraceae bacterium]|nr:hypothetical protein [Oscillospiraceae bacterium]
MDNRMRLLMLSLLTVILVASTVIADIWMAESQSVTNQTEIQQSAEGSSVELYVGQNGLWGARTNKGRILIQPAWYYLRNMSDSVLIARRDDGKEDRFGLIRTNGEILIPFLYTSISSCNQIPDMWLGCFTENGKEYCHLYHGDGTRWSDITWDSCSVENHVLHAVCGNEEFEGVVENNQLLWQHWQTAYPVGLHQLEVSFEENDLNHMPPIDTLNDLGMAAAALLRCMFITNEPPDPSLLNLEDGRDLYSVYQYRNCRLRKAKILRISQMKSEGLPVYCVQVFVSYDRTDAENGTETVETSMYLRVNRNTMGSCIYSGFSDSQQMAAG